MTFTSPLPPVSLSATPLTPFILERARRFGDKPAFIDGPSGRVMTYRDFEDAVRRQAGGWLERGLAPGDVVAIMAPNCPEYGVLFHAVALAGGLIVERCGAGGRVVKLLPPLTIDEGVLEEGLDILAASVWSEARKGKLCAL